MQIVIGEVTPMFIIDNPLNKDRHNHGVICSRNNQVVSKENHYLVVLASLFFHHQGGVRQRKMSLVEVGPKEMYCRM